MASSIEKLEGLKRRLKITIPADEVSKAYRENLKKIAKTAKIPGFRVGKVPPDLLEKRYGKSILEDVANELIQSNLEVAVKQHALKVAGMSDIKRPEEIKKDHPVELIVEFETYPEPELASLKGATVDRYVADITEEDVNSALNEIRKQHADWVEVDRPATLWDQVVIDFQGEMEGKPFDGGAAKGFKLYLGSKQMIPGFEEGIEGAKPGESRDIKVTFPKDYPNAVLAGKEAVFKITVHQVMDGKLPELNDELAKKMGFDKGVPALRDEARHGMEAEAKRVLALQLKMRILDTLIEKNPIEVPEALIEAEIDHLQQMTHQQIANQSGQSEEEVKKHLQLPRDPYREQAKKRVLMGILVGQVIKQHQIKVDQHKVHSKIEEIASAYQKPEEVVSWYYSNKHLLSEIESLVAEDQAVEKLLEQLETQEKKLSYEEVFKSPSPDQQDKKRT